MKIKSFFPKLVLAICIASIPLLFGWSHALASPPIETMKKSTARILCKQNSGMSTGSGFVVGKGKHVVTNWHVVDCTASGGKTTVLFQDQKRLAAVVRWRDPLKDLALLELEKKVDNPPVTFATRDMVKDTDTVYALGFPGLADILVEKQSLFKVKSTKGIISAKIRDRNQRAMYQIDAAINGGNSGGPLFNEYGHAIGINTIGVKADKGSGISWAVQVDELIPELKKMDILVKIADQWNFIDFIKTNLALLVGGLLACLLVGLVLISKIKRPGSGTKNGVKKPGGGKPLLLGLSGEYQGTTLELGSDPLVMGRDRGICQLVFSSKEISKRHCRLRFDAAGKTFRIEDAGSTNGTYLSSNGTRINPGQTVILKSGDGFYLSDPSTSFRVTLENVHAT